MEMGRDELRGWAMVGMWDEVGDDGLVSGDSLRGGRGVDGVVGRDEDGFERGEVVEVEVDGREADEEEVDPEAMTEVGGHDEPSVIESARPFPLESAVGNSFDEADVLGVERVGLL